MALEPDIRDYAVIDPAKSGDTRGTKPYLAMRLGERLVRQATFEGEASAAMFERALKQAQAVIDWETVSQGPTVAPD